MKNMRNMNRQGGAVAVIVGISIFLLVGFLAMVIDLGHVYIAKTELQNGADAAALAGAKELNSTKDGVASAIAMAQDLAGKNNYDFSNYKIYDTGDAISQNDAIDIWVGSSPNDSDMVLASTVTTDAAAANKTFLKVYTRNRDMIAWFAPIWNIFHVSTYGMAVAGRYTLLVTPMGVCAVDVDTNSGNADPLTHKCEGTGALSGTTLHECGFLRGIAYNMSDLNPLTNGDPIWINPVDIAGTPANPGACSNNSTSTSNMTPWVCTGKSATIVSVPGYVWVNTGTSSALDGPLNSRFGDNGGKDPYSGGQACDPTTAPPDTNVKEYVCTQQNGVSPNADNCSRNPSAGSPRDWMEGYNTPAPYSSSLLPTRQSIMIQQLGKVGGVPNPLNGKPFYYPYPPGRTLPESAADFPQYGVLWSYSKEVSDFTTNPYSTYNTTNWCAPPTCPTGTVGLYGGLATGYPTSYGAPYFAPSPFSTGPTRGSAYATPNRRVLNVAIIDCKGVTDIAGQGCKQMLPVLAIGQFFMQRQANLPTSVFGEFTGLVAPPLPPADIRLYR